MMRGLGLAALALASPGVAHAQDGGTVRMADHPGFGRIVFEFAAPTPYNVAVDGDRVLVVFDGAPPVAIAGTLPRNVRSAAGGPGTATLLLSPGARLRPVALGNRVVLDVLDPPRPAAARAARPPPTAPDATPGATPGAATSARLFPPAGQPGQPVPPAAPDVPVAGKMPAKEPVPEPSRPPAAPIIPEGPVPPRTVTQADLPSPVASGPSGGLPVNQPAMLTPPPLAPMSSSLTARNANAAADSVLAPAEAGVGAAALRRGADALIVFDGPVAVDLAQLRRLPALAGASVRSGVDSTVVLLPAPPDGIALVRESKGWRILIGPCGCAPVEAALAGPGILLKLAQPGRVVAVTDPAGGGTLLIGTANPASGPVGGVAGGATAPAAAVLPTWAGVAAEPFSDDVVLRPVAAGFLLEPAGATLPSAVQARAPIRRFDLPDLPVPVLLRRLSAAAAGAAAAPPRARTPGRIVTAQAMLALGLASDAASVLSLAAADDPAAADSPDIQGLSAIAALLAGRLDAASGLDAPGLDGSDEVALWRGVRDAMLGRTDAAARALPPLLPLALAYPQPLRDRILPLVAETAVLAGHSAAAFLPDLPHLGFARALQLERRGPVEPALAAFDALAAGPDGLDQVRAGTHAVELRLAAGQLSPADAAAAMNRLAATWRGDARELATRLRAAELHGSAGAWRPALDLLRETEALFPDAAPAIRGRMAAVFTAFAAQPDAMPPLDVLTLAADYADCIPPGTDIAGLLTDKLLALDLPARARALLASRTAAAPAGPVRAGLGHRLALLDLEAGNSAAAAKVLEATDLPGLPDHLASERALLRARIQAVQGNPAAAAASLDGAGSPAADRMRARLLEQAGDWRGAVQALDAVAARELPSDGPIPDDKADLVLRQASAAVQLGDAALLRSLGARYAARLSGPRADLFRLLTAAPVAGVGDLPRTASELTLARAVPATAAR